MDFSFRADLENGLFLTSIGCTLIHFYCFSQASQEELKAAYRRLCMLYHPDKHRDPELKTQAERLFNLVHQAYEGQWKSEVCRNGFQRFSRRRAVSSCLFKKIDIITK